jgi:hypothetical protein
MEPPSESRKARWPLVGPTSPRCSTTAYTGRKLSLTPAQADQLRQMAKNGEKKTALVAEYGISRGNLYAYLRAS